MKQLSKLTPIQKQQLYAKLQPICDFNKQRFFSKDFYGNSYRPSLNLTDKTIKDLIWYIWKERKNPGKF